MKESEAYNPEQPSELNFSFGGHLATNSLGLVTKGCLDLFVADNLCGWAMSQKLATHGYKWKKEDLLTKKNVSKLLNQRGTNIGYIFAVDLEYPESKHDSHNDYPLAREKMKVDNVEKLISY